MKKILIFVLLTAASPLMAQQQWTKDHSIMSDPATGTIAEYTHITTTSGSPFTYRTLLELDDSHLVLRVTMTDEDGSYDLSIESVSTGETLTIESDYEIEQRFSFGGSTLTIGYTEFTTYFDEHEDYTAAMRASAQTLLAGVSAEFQGELHDLAEIGCYHSIEWYWLTLMLNVFFDDLDFDDPADEKPVATNGRIAIFDPLTTPPNAFEQDFGLAYYE